MLYYWVKLGAIQPSPTGVATTAHTSILHLWRHFCNYSYFSLCQWTLYWNCGLGVHTILFTESIVSLMQIVLILLLTSNLATINTLVRSTEHLVNFHTQISHTDLVVINSKHTYTVQLPIWISNHKTFSGSTIQLSYWPLIFMENIGD